MLWQVEEVGDPRYIRSFLQNLSPILFITAPVLLNALTGAFRDLPIGGVNHKVNAWLRNTSDAGELCISPFIDP